MAACQSPQNEKKNKGKVSQYFTKILKKACYKTKLRFDTFQAKQSDKSIEYKGHICNGYINDVYVGQGCDDFKGNTARNNCAKKIINSILIKRIVVDESVVETLLKLLPNDYQKFEKPLLPTPRLAPHLPIEGNTEQSLSSGSNVEGKIVQKKITNVWQKMLAQVNTQQNIATRSSNQQNVEREEITQESIETKQIIYQHVTTERKSIQETQHTATERQSIQQNTATEVGIQKNTATDRQSIQQNTATEVGIQKNAGTDRQSIQQNTATGIQTNAATVGNIQQNTATRAEIQKNAATGGNIQHNTAIGAGIQKNAAIVGTVQGNFPKIPESNVGYQMLCQMGWTGGGLGREGNEGIEEPIVVNNVYGRQGLGMESDTSQQQQCGLQCKKKKKKQRQPIINRTFINKFVTGDRQEIVVSEALIADDYRLLQKLCDKNCLLYEFVGPSKHLVIRKPLNWETTTTGRRIAKITETRIQRQMNKIRFTKSSGKLSNPTNTDTSLLTNSKDIAMTSTAKHESTNETVSPMNVDTEHVAQNLTVQISSDLFAQAPYSFKFTITPDSTRHPSTGHGATSSRQGPSNINDTTTVNDISDVYGTSTGNDTLTGNGTLTGNSISDGTSSISNSIVPPLPPPPPPPMTQESIKTELLQLSTLEDFKLGDDVWETFLAFICSSDEQLNFSRNLTSKERLFLYIISDKYGFNFTLFSHRDEKNIVIRKC